MNGKGNAKNESPTIKKGLKMRKPQTGGIQENFEEGFVKTKKQKLPKLKNKSRLKVGKFLSSLEGQKRFLIKKRHNKYQKSMPRTRVEKRY